MYLDSDALLSHRYLHFKLESDHKTGEYLPKYIAEKWHLTFTYRDASMTSVRLPSLRIQGSLHKAYNAINEDYLFHENGYNGNDFSQSQVAQTIKYLSHFLCVDISKAKLTSLEIGLNIVVPVCPEQIIDGLLMHKGRQFNSSGSFPFGQANHSQYRVKCYDKGGQYRDHNNKFRIEIHYKKMELPNGLGCVFMSDLKNKAIISSFKRVLVSMWQCTTFFDYSIDREQLNDRMKTVFDLLSNPIYWKQLQPNRRHRPRERLKVLEQHHSDSIKKKVEQLIESKFDEMCNT